MTKISYKKYILFLFFAVCICIYLAKISSYVLIDILGETKFAAVAMEMKSLKSLFLPYLDGNICVGGGVLYYCIEKIFSHLLRSFEELSVRLPSVCVALGTLTASFLLSKRMVNQKFAIILTLVLFSNIGFITYSAVSNPDMFAACFIIIAVLSGISPIFVDRVDYKKYSYFAFWFFSLCAGFSGDISCVILPFIIVIPVLMIGKKINEFIAYENFLPGFVSFIIMFLFYFYCGQKFFEADFLYYIQISSVPKILLPEINNNYLYYLKYSLLYLTLGLMPWSVYIFPIFVSLLNKFFKEQNIFKMDLSQIIFDEGRKFFLISIWAFICSCGYYLIWQIDDYSSLLPIIFFASMTVAYYFYRHIFYEVHKKSVFIPSFIFYILLMVSAVILVCAYFMVSPLQKEYFETLILPVMFVTLIVSIPGVIAVVLNKKCINFSLHIVFSVLFLIITTSLLFNYINSFGENDLVNCAIKAKKDDAMLVTYNIKNKYSLIYYYGVPVIFNDKMDSETVYNNYGDTHSVYVVLKHNDLEYFDKFFVYEVVATGKQYSEITNIKYLPVDELESNNQENDET